MNRAAVWGVLLLAGRWAAAEDAEPLRVRGSEGRVAIYATTNAIREAVAWVPSDQDLTVEGELPDETSWVRIVPPESVGVWVYREFVRDGTVLADKVRVRAGAGMAFHTIGSLAKGQHVEVRGTYGDWIKISPPDDMSFWVLRTQVEPLAVMPPGGVVSDTNGTALVEGWETNGVPAWGIASSLTSSLAEASSPVSDRTPPPALAGCTLTDAPDQGERVTLSGILDWGVIGVVSAPYCLIAQQPNGDAAPVCHVLLAPGVPLPRVGDAVEITGTRWRVQGSELPAVLIDSVRAVPTP